MGHVASQRSVVVPENLDLSHGLEIDPRTLAYIRKSLGVLVEFAKSQGVSPVAIAAIAGDEIRQAIEEPLASSYATPEEGLAMLLDQEGGCVDVSEAATLYRKPDPVKTSAITEKIRNGGMVAYKTASSQYRIPRWQFRPEGGLISGLPQVLEALRQADPDPSRKPLAPFAFFLQPHPLTGEKTPLEVLRNGDVDTVMRAAASEAE